MHRTARERGSSAQRSILTRGQPKQHDASDRLEARPTATRPRNSDRRGSPYLCNRHYYHQRQLPWAQTDLCHRDLRSKEPSRRCREQGTRSRFHNSFHHLHHHHRQLHWVPVTFHRYNSRHRHKVTSTRRHRRPTTCLARTDLARRSSPRQLWTNRTCRRYNHRPHAIRS